MGFGELWSSQVFKVRLFTSQFFNFLKFFVFVIRDMHLFCCNSEVIEECCYPQILSALVFNILVNVLWLVYNQVWNDIRSLWFQLFIIGNPYIKKCWILNGNILIFIFWNCSKIFRQAPGPFVTSAYWFYFLEFLLCDLCFSWLFSVMEEGNYKLLLKIILTYPLYH